MTHSMKRIALVILIVMTASLIRAQATLTARDYFNELKTANAFGRYADEYVCFADKDTGNFAVLGKASDMIAAGMTMPEGSVSEKKAFLGILFVRNYNKGVAGEVNAYQAVGKGGTSYDIEFNAPLHNGRMVYSVNWITGRYLLQVYAQDRSRTVPVTTDSGKCELIHP